jgi:4-methyl-5(b-hydroxyethyl)-thiazole monophosphate biosynthesis
MKTALLLLATGFEEIEAIGTADVLRRGAVATLLASVTGNHIVTGAHNINVRADALIEDIVIEDFDALILPGGGPGSIMLRDHKLVRKAVTDYCNAGKLVAAICAAPRVFGSLGLLNGKNAICYPGCEGELTGAIIIDQPTVTDGNIITAKGPALVFDFALAILNYLNNSSDVSTQVADDLLLVQD